MPAFIFPSPPPPQGLHVSLVNFEHPTKLQLSLGNVHLIFGLSLDKRNQDKRLARSEVSLANPCHITKPYQCYYDAAPHARQNTPLLLQKCRRTLETERPFTPCPLYKESYTTTPPYSGTLFPLIPGVEPVSFVPVVR